MKTSIFDEVLARAMDDAMSGRRKRADYIREADVEAYDFSKVIRAQLGLCPLDGVEKEMHDELSRRCGGSFGGTIVPTAYLNRATRDMTVSGGMGTGGAFISQPVEPDVIPLWLNRSVLPHRGATYITGQMQNLVLPRQVSGFNVETPGETGAAAASDAQFDQVVYTPHKATTSQVYSRQLAFSASPSAGRFIARATGSALAQRMEYLALYGQGANHEPMGVANQPSTTSLAFGGNATQASLLQFLAALTDFGADQPGARLGWITSGGVRNKLLTLPKIAGSTTPIFLWEPRRDPGDDGSILDLGASVTNNVTNNQVFYGAWDQLLIVLFFDSIDVLVDDVTLAKSGKIQITAHAFFDCGPLHLKSFAVSNDPGNQ